MDNSPFGTLSAELRNRIYQLALLEPYGIVLAMKQDTLVASASLVPCYPGDVSPTIRFVPRPLTALLHTCRQISNETKSMYFSINRLVIDLRYSKAHTAWPVKLLRWTEMVGFEQVRHLRALEVIVSFLQVFDGEWDNLLRARHAFHQDADLELSKVICYSDDDGGSHAALLTVSYDNPARANEHVREQVERLCKNASPLAVALIEWRAKQMETLVDSTPTKL